MKTAVGATPLCPHLAEKLRDLEETVGAVGQEIDPPAPIWRFVLLQGKEIDLVCCVEPPVSDPRITGVGAQRDVQIKPTSAAFTV